MKEGVQKEGDVEMSFCVFFNDYISLYRTELFQCNRSGLNGKFYGNQ